MFHGLFILAALLVLWFDVKHPMPGKSSGFSSMHRQKLDYVFLAIITLSSFEIYPVLRATLSLPGYLPSDAGSHALVSMHLFDAGWLPAWSDRYVGGFPLGIHYPMLGWILTAVPIKLGASPTIATLVVGYLSVISVPLLFYVMARRNGAHVFSSLASALLLQWLNPLVSFVGNVDVFAVTGLLSQAVCTPILLLWAFELLGKGSTARAILLGILCVLAHPQITASSSLILGLCVVTTANRMRLRRYAIAQTAMVLVAVFVYGPGIVTMSIPFGWPNIPTWLHLGFGPERLYDWLVVGRLLDRERSPLITSMWFASLLLMAVRLRHDSIARATVVASVAGITLCIIGPTLATAGSVGAIFVSIFQPLRTLACLPFIVIGTLLVTFERYREAPNRWSDAVLRSASSHLASKWGGLSPIVRSLLQLLCASPVWLPIAITLRSSRTWEYALWTAELDKYTFNRPCGPVGPTRKEVTALQRRASTLRGGRLWFAHGPESTVGLCAITTGFERSASVPIAVTGAVGAHVGLLHEANARLHPEQPGLANRAEALGIRYLLLNTPLEQHSSHQFELMERFGPLHLYTRTTPNDYFGLGCTEAKLSGGALNLHKHLIDALAHPDDRECLLNPTQLTGVTITTGVVERTTRRIDCRIPEGATLREIPRPVGQYAAFVDTPSTVQLVLRATAHGSWNITVDGRRVNATLVAPGFYALTLPLGHHAIEAKASISLVFLFGLFLAILLPLGAFVVQNSRKKRHPARS